MELFLTIKRDRSKYYVRLSGN
jgi:hypothetical protein